MIAARSLPPFGCELQSDPGISFRQMPVAVLPKLLEKFHVNLNKDVGGISSAWQLGARLA
jgi:hypothetical protein